jgi:tRNA modification GTPase
VIDTPGETIIAIATPAGRGALSVVRLSGPQAARAVLRRLKGLSGGLPARRPVLARLESPDGRPIDQVLVTLFPAPASYTGEDVVEISAHGSPPVVRKIMRTLLGDEVRLARPGEFTLRAFLNGKMDLAQAEAVRDLIQSQTGFQARLAAEQLEGALSQVLRPLKEELVEVICQLETRLEFVEEDVAPAAAGELARRLRHVRERLGELEGSYRTGKVVREGVTIALVGRPNVGKSSLFNRLLQEDRAIVTEIPGTTRDALTESISLEGIPARLVDTAGIRPGGDRLESLGVERSLDYLKKADLSLFILDGSEAFGEGDAGVWEVLRGCPFLLVCNKRDRGIRVRLPARLRREARGRVEISALRGTGLGKLRAELVRAVAPERERAGETAIITQLRHRDCLARTTAALEAALAALEEGLSEEFPLYDLRRALGALGEITGETSVEELLGRIFSTFCIGK